MVRYLAQRARVISYLIPVLLDTSLGPIWERLSAVSKPHWWLSCGRTLAISFQLLPMSRICLSLCSSAAVHGVFVRLRFLPLLSSDSRFGMDTLAEELLSAIGIAGGGFRSNCLVSLVGLREAGLLRGFGAGREGGFVSSVARGATGSCEGGGSSADCGGNSVLETPVLGRLDEGGVLSRGISSNGGK